MNYRCKTFLIVRLYKACTILKLRICTLCYCCFRLGSLFSLLVYSSANKSLSTNDSILIASVEPYQLQPSTVYVAGAPEDFPTFGGESWQGCLSQLSVNGRFLSLLHKDSEGTMPDGCADMRFV